MKYLTREQLRGRKEKAVRFVRDVLGDPERAAEIAAEPLEAYAARRRIELLNPPRERRAENMPETKAGLQTQLEEAEEALAEIYSQAEDALDAELTREEVIAAVKKISELAEPFAEEEEEAEEPEEEAEE